MPSLEVTDRERRQYPTYKTAQRVVNGDMTAPVEFLGWTALRSIIIMPGLAIAGIRGKQLLLSALAGSTFVSLFALYRTYTTKNMDKYRMRQLMAAEREISFPTSAPRRGARRRGPKRPKRRPSRMRRAS